MSTLFRTMSVILLSALTLATVLLSFVSPAFAEPSYTINYQGKLTDSSGLAVADGTYNMRFWLLQSLSQATTSAIWTESLTSGNRVTVQNGLFSVMLGSTSALTGVDFNQPLFLGVEIGGTAGTPAWDGEMSPRKPLGTVPSAFEARRLGGVASSSFLRSDQADTASGLLTFTGGLLSNSSSTLSRFNFVNATGTSLYIGGDRITDFVGTGLTLSGTTLTASLGTDITAAEVANGDHGFFSYIAGVAALDTGGITSLNLSDALTNETGSGAAVFANAPTFTGTVLFGDNGIQVGSSVPFSDASGTLTLQNVDVLDSTTENTLESAIDTLGNLTSAAALATVGTITSGTWQGNAITDTYIADTLTIGSGSVIADDVITPNDVKTGGQVDEYCLTYETTLTTWEWQSCATAGLAIGNSITSATQGSVLFAGASGVLAQDNANFFFDDTNNRLGLGTTTPNARLTVQGDINISQNSAGLSFVGTRYLYASSTNDSIALGENAGATWVVGTVGNVALGEEAGRYASTSDADYNFYVGTRAGYYNTGGDNNFLGRQSGYQNTGDNNNIFGINAGFTNSGSDSNIFGFEAGYNNAGSNNNIFGFQAGYANSGSDNLIMGNSAGENNTGDDNNIIGSGFLFGAGYSNTGNKNNIFGYTAGVLNTGDNNNLLGERAGYNNSGSFNNLIGYYAGYNNSGVYNDIIGYRAGRYLQSTSSIAIGGDALYGSHATTFISLNNVALGYRAGYASDDGSGNNILIGYQAADNLTTGNNNIIIGYDIDSRTATTDNALNIGNLIFGSGLDGTGTTIATGNIGIATTTTSARLVVQSTGTTDILNLFETGGAEVFSVLENGNVGVGDASPSALFTVGTSDAFTINASGVITSSNNITPNSILSTGQIDEYCLTYEATATTFEWQSCGGGGLLASDIDTSAELDAIVTDDTGSGALVFGTSPVFTTSIDIGAAGVRLSDDGDGALTFLGLGDGFDENLTLNLDDTSNTGVFTSSTGLNLLDFSGIGLHTDQSIGISSTSPNAKFGISRTGFSTAGGVALTDEWLQTTNSTNAATQYGKRFYWKNGNTATTTIVGSLLRIEDNTNFGNTVRGLEVQTNRGTTTKGENTAISGTARTFGIRGVTEGDAGGSFEPAGGFFQTRGTNQGNAIRGYSASITSASLMSLFHDTSTFTGTGLEMNFGNTTGSFSNSASKFLDLQNAGTSAFIISAYGTTTIGNGTNQAGLQIRRGGLCVDNDGNCTASTTGRISSVSSYAGNSDLAEMYFSSTALETGEVVTLTGGLSIERAGRSSKTPILGVISTKPGLLLGFDDESLKSGETGYPVALAGRVPIKLSNENGPIKKGDTLMLSSIPGVAMKATSTGATIGIALEDFDDSLMYSTTFINQFGDDMVDPALVPIIDNDDPRINDGCYYGGGGEVGDAPCVPLLGLDRSEQIAAANQLIEARREVELRELAATPSVSRTLVDGRVVKVGQVVMFVDLSYRWLNASQAAALGTLFGTTALTNKGDNKTETVFDRLVILANSFVDGILSIFELNATRVEVSEELCVDGVCVNADDLRRLLDGTNTQPSQNLEPPTIPIYGEQIVTPNPDPTPVIEEIPDTTVEEGEVAPTTSSQPVAEELPEPEPVLAPLSESFPAPASEPELELILIETE